MDKEAAIKRIADYTSDTITLFEINARGVVIL